MFEQKPSLKTSFEQSVNPLFIVLSGPSGAGKDAVLRRMKEMTFPVSCVVTMTTRQKRDSEREGTDYHFVSREKFQEMRANDEFLECAEVYGNWYGLPKEAVRNALASGRDVIVRVDVQGAATIKRKAPEAVFVFLLPPTLEELVTRLRERHTESEAELALRTRMASEEVKCLLLFDYVVVNRQGQLDSAVAEIKAIIAAEKCRVNQREIKL